MVLEACFFFFLTAISAQCWQLLIETRFSSIPLIIHVPLTVKSTPGDRCCCGIVIICKIPELINLIDGVRELLLQLDFAADYHLEGTWTWPGITLPLHKTPLSYVWSYSRTQTHNLLNSAPLFKDYSESTFKTPKPTFKKTTFLSLNLYFFPHQIQFCPTSRKHYK